MQVRFLLKFGLICLLFYYTIFSVFEVFFSKNLLLSDISDYDLKNTAFKNLEERVQGTTTALPNPPHVRNDGSIECGDFLAFGQLEKGIDANEGALGKAAKIDLESTVTAKKYLDESSYKIEPKENETFFDLQQRLSQEADLAQESIYTKELQNSLRINAYGYERLRMCERLYYDVIKNNVNLNKEYAKKVAEGFVNLKFKTNSER